MKLHSIFFTLASTLATLAACSAGDGGPANAPPTSNSGTPALGGFNKFKTCKNVELSKIGKTPDACDFCDAEKCKVESANVLGSDPDDFGGTCGAFIACSCACAGRDDIECLKGCAPFQIPACEADLKSVRACEQQKCPSECAKDGG
jgi:hypothetical protein